MHVLKRIRDKRRSRSHTKSTSELGAAIDYSGSDAYEDSEHPQCATPVTKSPMGAWSPKNNPSVKGALKVITNLSAFDRAGPSAGRFSVSPESPTFEPRLSASPATPLHSPSRNATPKQSALKRYEPLPPLPPTDLLPVERDALEVLLNNHTTQLAYLADRIENINEWIELDGCRLDRLMHEAERRFLDDEAQKAEEVENERLFVVQRLLPSRPSTPFQSGRSKGKSPAKGVGFVGFGDLPPLTKDHFIDEDLNVRDVRERILAAKRLRVDLARSVHWHREEHSRVEEKLGIDRSKAIPGNPENMNGWGVGGKTWEKTCGRLPDPDEWSEMLSSNRFQWDEEGTRRGTGRW